MFDPQTSGGLLMAVAPEQVDVCLATLVAAGQQGHVIGEVRAAGSHPLTVER